MSGRGVFPALWSEQESQRGRLHHQYMWLGEGLWIPGSGPLCVCLSGGCGSGARPWEALQWTQTRPSTLCACCAPAQVWRSGGTLQRVQTGDSRREDSWILLRLSWLVLLSLFFWSAFLRRPHLQDRSTIHSRLLSSTGNVSGWHTAEAGACDTRKRPYLSCAERE